MMSSGNAERPEESEAKIKSLQYFSWNTSRMKNSTPLIAIWGWAFSKRQFGQDKNQ